jgi:hypothetical protein|tara:strand:- start:1152 stop:1490 length:339 start_codon:yes stop_codon:yes gene_type:complete
MITKTKTQFLTEALIEQCNNQWKVNSIESGRCVYSQVELQEGKKYFKILMFNVVNGNPDSGRSCWMFVDKNDGAVYKPASWKAPAKGIRFWIEQLADNPEICDPYGSFLYVR